jgi:hypothetical protein
MNDVLLLPMSRKVTRSLKTHLEIPSKLLIEFEVVGTGPRCFREHFLAVTESIAFGRVRLKKIRKFSGATAEALSFAGLQPPRR